MGAVALLSVGLLTGCDSVVGIEGSDSPQRPRDTRPHTATSIAAAVPSPGTAPGYSSVTVALATPDPAAADALTRWAMDLQSASPQTLQKRCWTMAPRNVDSMYADKQAILDALRQVGVDDGTRIVWQNPRAGVSVVAQRTDIATGYACPRVVPTGAEVFDDADARHTVRRYLARLTGNPIDPADKETTHPLVCAAGVGWDPTGAGRTAAAPLASAPGKLGPVRSFVDDSLTSQPLRGDYTTVSVPVTGASGAQRERTFTLKSGERGYCIGDVSA
ncbi:hypothetical protein NDR87_23310 [Nocardia sp. CDC159]|uniref:Uncharacterized protein n=1 Tax=Nocardia pulmonis TaxID=2951408 RepID=A0A9X2EER0_9NOCA|nr:MULTISPECIES: hypothetical protein [Nocardia]MCM6776878.1 hypothetical protein [Nocardia pulmonis]MCM6789302.1 hypothetical protein [Nocardia sp. CDC159]